MEVVFSYSELRYLFDNRACDNCRCFRLSLRFQNKRDRIAELLFSCKATKCLGCDRIELALPNTDCLTTSENKYKSVVEAGGSKDTKESKVNSCSRDDNEDQRKMAMKVNQISNFSYGDAEALNDEIDEEYQFHGEVLRIKEILDNNQEESDSLLFESLRRLRLMNFNVETLKDTEIGKSVNGLRKHRLKEIRSLARALVEDWKIMVDSWVNTTASIAAAEVATESVKTSTIKDEEGLPSPPMDEGAFFATPTSMELSRFFDGMDDDGNPQPNGNFDITRGSTTKPQKGPVNSNSYVLPKAEQKRNVKSTMKKQPGWPNESAPDRLKPSLKPKLNNVQNVKKDHGNEMFQKPMPRLENPAHCDEGSVGMKLEAAKRKLQERYQEAENAKKQRTIQVVELHDLPKQSLVQRNQHYKPGMQRKQWCNRRR